MRLVQLSFLADWRVFCRPTMAGLPVDVDDFFPDARALRRAVVNVVDGTPVFLDDVADLRLGQANALAAGTQKHALIDSMAALPAAMPGSP